MWRAENNAMRVSKHQMDSAHYSDGPQQVVFPKSAHLWTFKPASSSMSQLASIRKQNCPGCPCSPTGSHPCSESLCSSVLVDCILTGLPFHLWPCSHTLYLTPEFRSQMCSSKPLTHCSKLDLLATEYSDCPFCEDYGSLPCRTPEQLRLTWPMKSEKCH